jgi:hypothetical protein
MLRGAKREGVAPARGAQKTFLTGFVFSPKTVPGRAQTLSALW